MKPICKCKESKEVSNCCQAPIKVVGSDEGTNHWECDKCEHGTFPCFSSGICKVPPHPQESKENLGLEFYKEFGYDDRISKITDWWLEKISKERADLLSNLAAKVEGMKKITHFTYQDRGKSVLHNESYNQALEDIIKLIKE
jgi:hypothetical protein